MSSKTTSLHEDLSREEEVRGSSDRSFGLVFAGVFLLVGLYPLRHGASVSLPWLAAAGAMALLALVAPRVLSPFNRLWLRLGLLLGRVVTPIVMAVLYYGVFTPIGLVSRSRARASLGLRYSPEAESYWIRRDPPGPEAESMSRQF